MGHNYGGLKPIVRTIFIWPKRSDQLSSTKTEDKNRIFHQQHIGKNVRSSEAAKEIRDDFVPDNYVDARQSQLSEYEPL